MLFRSVGYELLVDALEKNCGEEMIFAKRDELETVYSIPSAFEAYMVTAHAIAGDSQR